jgi:ATP-dependent DNA helicase PIF1
MQSLGTVFHQAGEDPVQVSFRLRSYSTNEEDYELFTTHFWDVLTPGQKIEFDDVLHLLPTCVSVLEFSSCYLAATAKLVLCCKAEHNHAEAKKAKADDADGLENEILLAEGAKVMLTHNLCLVNGAQGIVKKIWFDQGSNPCSHLPAVVFVEFSGYSGPETPEWEGISPSWVPIVPSVAQWENKSGKALACTQLPLTMAWGITIHKSQAFRG